MISKCVVIIILISLIYSIFTGNSAGLTTAVIDGCGKSIRLSIELCGMSCLWCGVMQVFSDSGILDKTSRLLSPLLSRIFPEAWRTGVGRREITASVSANLLGIGNAATPYALRAMEKLDSANGNSYITSADMAMFAIIGTASFNIVPTTLITLLRSAGASEPYRIIVPIWICSVVCMTIAVLAAKLIGSMYKNHGGGRK